MANGNATIGPCQIIVYALTAAGAKEATPTFTLNREDQNGDAAWIISQDVAEAFSNASSQPESRFISGNSAQIQLAVKDVDNLDILAVATNQTKITDTTKEIVYGKAISGKSPTKYWVELIPYVGEAPATDRNLVRHIFAGQFASADDLTVNYGTTTQQNYNTTIFSTPAVSPSNGWDGAHWGQGDETATVP